MSYKHLLVAVDATEDRGALLNKAHALAKTFNSRLSVLSVMLPPLVDSLAVDAGMGVPVLSGLAADPSWAVQLRARMHQSLSASCAPLGIAESDIHLVVNHIDHGILDSARDLKADLIVIGHHHHKGWFARLLAHTDQSVIGKATCDVLVMAL